MQTIGFFGALIVGLTLGLFGAGGSILTVPVLYYFFGMSATLSTAHSLFIVGFTALVGAVPNMIRKQVSYKTAVVFAIPSMIAVYCTQRYLMPAVPEHLFSCAGLEVTKEIGIMVFFAVIMMLASRNMIKERKIPDPEYDEKVHFNVGMIIIIGASIGIIAGIVGAGGGFLIIPALVLYARVPMKVAVGTSLLIIAINSMVGFQGALAAGTAIDWKFIAEFSALTAAGILLGSYLAKFVNGQKLKGAFGWFVLFMGIYIIIRELFFRA